MTALAEKTASGVDWATYSAQSVIKLLMKDIKIFYYLYRVWELHIIPSMELMVLMGLMVLVVLEKNIVKLEN